MEKSIFNFHVDYLNPSLRTGLGGLPELLTAEKNDLSTIFVCHFLHVRSSVLCGCRANILFAFIIIFNVCFRMSPHINARQDSKSHWLHLFNFSPLYLFRCVLNIYLYILGSEETYICIGCISFSTLCIFICVLKFPLLYCA